MLHNVVGYRIFQITVRNVVILLQWCEFPSCWVNVLEECHQARMFFLLAQSLKLSVGLQIIDYIELNLAIINLWKVSALIILLFKIYLILGSLETFSYFSLLKLNSIGILAEYGKVIRLCNFNLWRTTFVRVWLCRIIENLICPLATFHILWLSLDIAVVL
jgi:hypothetical protein